MLGSLTIKVVCRKKWGFVFLWLEQKKLVVQFVLLQNSNKSGLGCHGMAKKHIDRESECCKISHFFATFEELLGLICCRFFSRCLAEDLESRKNRVLIFWDVFFDAGDVLTIHELVMRTWLKNNFSGERWASENMIFRQQKPWNRHGFSKEDNSQVRCIC